MSSVLADAGSAVGTVIGLALLILVAYICHRIAVSKGRGPILWFVLGLIFPVIALIVILLLPRKDPVRY